MHNSVGIICTVGLCVQTILMVKVMVMWIPYLAAPVNTQLCNVYNSVDYIHTVGQCIQCRYNNIPTCTCTVG